MEEKKEDAPTKESAPFVKAYRESSRQERVMVLIVVPIILTSAVKLGWDYSKQKPQEPSSQPEAAHAEGG